MPFFVVEKPVDFFLDNAYIPKNYFANLSFPDFGLQRHEISGSSLQIVAGGVMRSLVSRRSARDRRRANFAWRRSDLK